jgi:hypothetical protein
MATKNEDQTKYSHLSSNLLEQENERNPDPSCSSAWATWKMSKTNPYIINQNHIFFLNYCEVISG